MENAAMSTGRVLVVEDEMIVAMFVEDVLADLGYETAGIVSRMEDGIARAADKDFDLAILDVHLNGKEVFPLADALTANKVPVIFATGYGARGLPDRYRGFPVLQKPFQPEDLAKVLAESKKR